MRLSRLYTYLLRTFFCFFFLCFIALPKLRAQLMVGGRTGMNIARTLANDPSGTRSKLGINFGATATYGFGTTKKLAGVAELVFDQKGGTNNSSGKNSFSYIQLPVLLRYHIQPIKETPFHIFINGGIYSGFKVRTRTTSIDSSTSVVPKSHWAELGITYGLGVKYTLGPGDLFLEYRYGHALTNVRSTSLERNILHSISIGYLYPLIKAKLADKEPTKDGFE